MYKKLSTLLIIICSILFFTNCQSSVKKNKLSTKEQAELISKGKKITMLSFKSFSGELMKALQEGGVQHAAGYCHLKASPLIDSLSMIHGAKISRISDKFRNPTNRPDELDLTVIEAYRQQITDGKDLEPHLEITADEIVFYSPILILNPACLQCHGEPGSTMEQQNFEFIQSKYPGDLATGYKLGDLRGVWKIVF